MQDVFVLWVAFAFFSGVLINNGESGTGKELVTHVPASPQSARQDAVYRAEYGSYPKISIE
ncbi:hypothetical protein ACNKHV_24605 [Shigella flexneri]